jgi:hypothetical protein
VNAEPILENSMKIKIVAAVAALFLALPVAAEGAHEGERLAGPVGGVVGGVVRGVAAGVAGVLGVEQRPRFRDYAVHEHHRSYTYDHAVSIGAALPEDGITYYDIPPEYGVHDYRYTIVNDQTVLVDPRTHRIVDVIQ